jgi:hypothetical protein
MYLVFALGFGVIMHGLFFPMGEFHSYQNTFFVIVQVTLGGVDFSDFSGDPFGGVGQFLYLLIILAANILLLNLVIANMSVCEMMTFLNQYINAMTTYLLQTGNFQQVGKPVYGPVVEYDGVLLLLLTLTCPRRLAS